MNSSRYHRADFKDDRCNVDIFSHPYPRDTVTVFAIQRLLLDDATIPFPCGFVTLASRIPIEFGSLEGIVGNPICPSCLSVAFAVAISENASN